MSLSFGFGLEAFVRSLWFCFCLFVLISVWDQFETGEKVAVAYLFLNVSDVRA